MNPSLSQQWIISLFPGHPCTLPNDPINGHKNCTEDKLAVHCTLACREGFAFAFSPIRDYSCQVTNPVSILRTKCKKVNGQVCFTLPFISDIYFDCSNGKCQVSGSGEWFPSGSTDVFPDCSIASLASTIAIPTHFQMDVISSRPRQTSLCDDKFFMKQVQFWTSIDILRTELFSRLPLM